MPMRIVTALAAALCLAGVSKASAASCVISGTGGYGLPVKESAGFFGTTINTLPPGARVTYLWSDYVGTWAFISYRTVTHRERGWVESRYLRCS